MNSLILKCASFISYRNIPQHLFRIPCNASGPGFCVVFIGANIRCFALIVAFEAGNDPASVDQRRILSWPKTHVFRVNQPLAWFLCLQLKVIRDLVTGWKWLIPPHDISHKIIAVETIGVLHFQQWKLFSPRLLRFGPGRYKQMLAVLFVSLGRIIRANVEDGVVKYPIFVALDDDAVNTAIPHDIVVDGQASRLVITPDAHASKSVVSTETFSPAAVHPVVVNDGAAALGKLRVNQRNVASKQAAVIDVVVFNSLIAARTLEQSIAAVIYRVVARDVSLARDVQPSVTE